MQNIQDALETPKRPIIYLIFETSSNFLLYCDNNLVAGIINTLGYLNLRDIYVSINLCKEAVILSCSKKDIFEGFHKLLLKWLNCSVNCSV